MLVDEDVDAFVRNVVELRMDLVSCVQRIAAGDCGVDAYLQCLCVSSLSCPRCSISFCVFGDGYDSVGSRVFASFRRWSAYRKVVLSCGNALYLFEYFYTAAEV